MSAFDLLPRTSVRLNALCRHHWGPQRDRTVRLAVIDTGEKLVARVIGSENSTAVVLEERVAALVDRRGVTLDDGTRWDVKNITGCACQVPSALKGLDPRKV